MARKARRFGLISAGVAAALTVVASVAVAEGTGPSTNAASTNAASGGDSNTSTTGSSGSTSSSDPASASGAPTAVDAATATTAAPVVPRLPAGARVTGQVAGSALLHLSVNLEPRDPKALQAFVTAVSTPGSPRYHHYLAKGQFAGEFGPTGRTLAHVEAVLRDAGLTVGKPSADGLSLPVTATAAQATRLLGTGFNSVKLADGTSGYANTKPAVLPASLSGVVSGVSGLTSVNRMHAHHDNGGRRAVVAPHTFGGSTTNGTGTGTSADAAGAHVATAGATAYCSDMSGVFSQWGVSDTNGFYSPGTLASVYGMSTAPTAGAGQTVAVFELESVDTQALDHYQKCIGTKVPVSVVPVGNAAANLAPDGQSVGVESALDIEDLVGLLPGATQILDYEGNDSSNSGGNNELDLFRRIVQDDKAQVISTSWGLCETHQDPNNIAAENTIFAMAAAQGQTVVAASGDSGSSDCYDVNGRSGSTGLAVDDPASQPYVTGVGGTWMKGSGRTLAQGVWNRVDNGSSVGAGGGGVSVKWRAPAYQGGFSGRGARTVPDVSALADPYTGYPILLRQNGSDVVGIEGGTSAAAPTWAALIAQANTSPTCRANARQAGFVSPALYDAARGNYGAGFYDVTSGSNALPGLQASRSFAAGSGYDAASGLGTPKLAGLVGSLCAPRGTAASGPATYHTMTPTRFLDTYAGRGWGVNGTARTPLPAGGTAPVRITGRNGVPATGVTAVTVNVTVASVNGGGGALMAYADGAPRPGAQQIFWSSSVGRRVALITVQVPADGVVDFFSNNAIHLTVDVEGYWTNDARGTSYTGATTPVHVLDTRRAIGVTTTRPASNTALTFKVLGAGAPAGVKAAALNLLALGSGGSGYLKATAGGGAQPNTVNVAWTPGSGYVSNLAYVPVNPATGTVTVYVAGTTHVTADLQGYFVSGGTTTFLPLAQGQAPRVLDTRNAIGVPTRTPLRAGHAVSFRVTGSGRPVPAGAKYVLLDVTAIDTAGNGGLVAYATHAPGYQDCYWLKGQLVAEAVLVPVNPATGSVTIRVSGTTDVIADVQGWFS